jgi:glycosyltransferase involved in cell wall biosynthesis
VSPTRILHAPTDVGGHAFQLSRAERELGLESDVVVFGPSKFGYGADITVGLEGASGPRRLARRLRFLRAAARRYDVFHFNFGQPLIAIRRGGRVLTELPLLKRLGKTVLVTFQGCDVRPYERCFCGRESCRAETAWREPNASAMSRHADRVFFLNPDLREWLPGGRFLPYANVDVRSVRPQPLPEGDELVVAHAPTNRAVKGTAHLVEAVDNLRREGLPLRLDLLEGIPRDEVLDRLASADLVVDQLLLGWFGGFAVEAMALGRPVLSFIREDEPADNPFGDELPIVRTTTATLAQDLRALVHDADRRREAGAAGASFVERHHDPRRVARTVLEGLVPLPSLSSSRIPDADLA